MMELLERFVSAVERIAAAMESRAVSIAAAAEVLEEHREAVSMTEDFPIVAGPAAGLAESAEPVEPEEFPESLQVLAASGGEVVDREKIKKELDALGVEYAPKARAGTLLQLLGEARAAAAKAASIPERQEEPPVDENVALLEGDLLGVINPEEALQRIRDGLKRVAMQEGTDAARDLLKLHGGGAESVSRIDPKFYGPLLNALGGAA